MNTMKKTAYIMIGIVLWAILNIPSYTMSEVTKPVFKYGFSGSPETIDPAQAWDSSSYDILEQVMEGLVAYNLTDPELSVIPRLAIDTGTWNAEATELTFHLREGVTFHDGTPFNATAVKYTFDRLNHLLEGYISQLWDLYTPLRQLYPMTPFVINETVVINEYTIKFVLNYPYVALTDLLCFSGSYIVHPAMPFDRLLELDESLIGTGPYTLDLYSAEEIRFTAYEGYYRPQPDIQEMVWKYYEDHVLKHQALLSGEIDMVDSELYDYYDEDMANPNITVQIPVSSGVIQYVFMNNHFFNKTMRQAISFAVNYDYIITHIMNNLVVRAGSPVPKGIRFHDSTVTPATYNLKHARQILVDANLSKGLTATSSDLQWHSLTELNPIATFLYAYHKYNRVRGDVGLLLATNLDLIGIHLELWGFDWTEICPCGWCPEFEMGLTAWAPDFNDPSNIINILFSNTSSFNAANVNDSWLQNAMIDALKITNETARREKYSEIQHYIVEDLMPCLFLYQNLHWKCHSRLLGNYSINIMNKVAFYACSWYPTPENTSTTSLTSSSSDNPSIPGYSFLMLISIIIIVVRTLSMKFFMDKSRRGKINHR